MIPSEKNLLSLDDRRERAVKELDIVQKKFDAATFIDSVPEEAHFASNRLLWEANTVIARGASGQSSWREDPQGYAFRQIEAGSYQLTIKLRSPGSHVQSLLKLKEATELSSNFTPLILGLHMLLCVGAALAKDLERGFVLTSRMVTVLLMMSGTSTNSVFERLSQAVSILSAICFRIDRMTIKVMDTGEAVAKGGCVKGKGEKKKNSYRQENISEGLHPAWSFFLKVSFKDGSAPLVGAADHVQRLGVDWLKVANLEILVTPGRWARHLLVKTKQTGRIFPSLVTQLATTRRTKAQMQSALVYLIHCLNLGGKRIIKGSTLVDLLMGFDTDMERVRAMNDKNERHRAADYVDRFLVLASRFFLIVVRRESFFNYAKVETCLGGRFIYSQSSERRFHNYIRHYLDASFTFELREQVLDVATEPRSEWVSGEWIQRLRLYLRREGYTHEQVGKWVGKSQVWVSRRLSGKFRLSKADALRISKAVPGFKPSLIH